MRSSWKTLSIAALLMGWPAFGEHAKQDQSDAVAEDPPGSHNELEPLKIEFGRLSALCLHPSGNLLAGDAESKEIKVIDPQGKQVDTFKLALEPYAIDVAADGTIYCGGHDRLAMLDAGGKVLKTAQIVEDTESARPDQPPKDEPPKDQTRHDESEHKRPRRTSRAPRVSGIAVSGDDVFVAFGSGWSLRSKSTLFRFDRQLDNSKMVAEGLRGCCQRCDITASDGVLYVAENAAFRVTRFDREGNVLSKWGSRDRKSIEGFGACCNPMNICFDSDGVLYTAESGPGRVKRYSTEGEFLGLVGHAGVDRFDRASHFASTCSNIAIAVTGDGKRVYVMDYRNNLIRVLQK